MKLFKSIGYNFTTYFFEKGQLLSFYKLQNDKQNLLIAKNDTELKSLSEIYTIDLVPSFFKLDFNENVSSFNYNYFEGFGCDLNHFLSAQDYLVKQQGSKAKKNFNRRIKKLEKCFPITYKVFCGDFSKDVYADLMATLKSMITIRFQQRNTVHGDLGDWDFYTNTCYDLIKSKRACLYVIYNGDKPISISINYLFDNIFESAISSYDIDYAKFGLGNILVYKKIEWCLENGYSMLNMRWGDYPYKREWCNTVYKYQNHVVFKKGSLNSFLKACFVLLKNLVVLFAIKNKSTIYRFMSFNKKEKTPVRLHENIYEVVSNSSNIQKKNDIIDLNSKEFNFLNKAVIDFQYISNETSENLKIYKQNNKSFFIEGLSKGQLVNYK